MQDVLFFGSRGEQIEFFVERGRRRQPVKKAFEGVIKELEREWHSAGPWEKERFERYINLIPCPACKGREAEERDALGPVRRPQYLPGHQMTIAECREFFGRDRICRRRTGRSPGPILKEIISRLKFLIDVGLDYISLDRSSGDPVVRRITADPARDADRLGPHGRALRARRAEHRPPSARQRAPPRHPAKPARPGQHGRRGRARLRHHPSRPITSSTWGRAPARTGAYLVFTGTPEELKKRREVDHRALSSPTGGA